MYIEMIDETGQVSQEIMEQTIDLLNFAAQKTGKEEKGNVCHLRDQRQKS